MTATVIMASIVEPVLVAAVENLWDKYAVSNANLEQSREATLDTLSGFLTGLGYV